MKLIDKSALVAEIESKKKYAQTLGDNAINSSMQQFYDGMKQGCVDLLSFINTLEVKDVNSVWHNIDDIPNYNLNGISDFIIDSCYGHIYGEAHSYTPEQWSAHIGFNANRQFRWAYEKDLIEVQKGKEV